MYYKLDENKKVFPSSMEEWAEFHERRLPTNYWDVGKDTINGKLISTVFIGLSYNSRLFLKLWYLIMKIQQMVFI